MAHKLARLVYRMVKWGHEYVDQGPQYYEERHHQQQVQLLTKRRQPRSAHCRTTDRCPISAWWFLES
jgi:hypothetical protein